MLADIEIICTYRICTHFICTYNKGSEKPLNIDNKILSALTEQEQAKYKTLTEAIQDILNMQDTLQGTVENKLEEISGKERTDLNGQAYTISLESLLRCFANETPEELPASAKNEMQEVLALDNKYKKWWKEAQKELNKYLTQRSALYDKGKRLVFEGYKANPEEYRKDLEEELASIEKKTFKEIVNRWKEINSIMEHIKAETEKATAYDKANFENAYKYILYIRLEFFVEATEYIGSGQEALKKKAEELAGTWYKKPAKWNFENVAPVKIDNRVGTRKVPVGAVSVLYNDTIGSGGKFRELAEGRNKILNGNGEATASKEKYIEDATGQMQIASIFSFETRNTQAELSLPDAEKLLTNNINAAKQYNLMLEYMNLQGFFNGTPNKVLLENGNITPAFTMPLKELVDIGIYRDMRSARKGFKNNMEALTKLHVKATVERGTSREQSADAILFIGSKIDNSTCTVYCSPLIDNWRILGTQFTELPRSYYSLPSKPAQLLYHIMAQARQELSKSGNSGTFNMRLSSIRTYLNIRQEGTKDVNGKVLQPILEAIKEVQETEPDIHIEIKIPEGATTAADKIQQGYIIISMYGQYAYNLLDIESQRTAKTQQAIDKANKYKKGKGEK